MIIKYNSNLPVTLIVFIYRFKKFYEFLIIEIIPVYDLLVVFQYIQI